MVDQILKKQWGVALKLNTPILSKWVCRARLMNLARKVSAPLISNHGQYQILIKSNTLLGWTTLDTPLDAVTFVWPCL